LNEKLDHYGLADLLNVSSQMIKEKIIKFKRHELEQLGKIEIKNGAIELNVDQILYVTYTLQHVDIETKIAFTKALFCYDKEEPETVSYEQIVSNLPKLELNNTNKTNLECFTANFNQI